MSDKSLGHAVGGLKVIKLGLVFNHLGLVQKVPGSLTRFYTNKAQILAEDFGRVINSACNCELPACKANYTGLRVKA